MRPKNTAALIAILCLSAVAISQTTPLKHQGEEGKTVHARNAAPDMVRSVSIESQAGKSAAPPAGSSSCNGAVMTLAVAAALIPELKTFQRLNHVAIVTDGKKPLSAAIRHILGLLCFRGLILGVTVVLLFSPLPSTIIR
jgi:hypothetical protein